MFITEIFQKSYPKRTVDEVLKDPDIGQFIGYGYYSHVFEDKTNPQHVIKVGEIQEGISYPENDGYLSYLNKLKKYHNPVMPQVESIEIFEDPSSPLDHPYIYKVKMERLYKTKEITAEEKEALYDRLFGDYDVSRYEQFGFRKHEPTNFLYSALEDNELFKAIKDPYTRQALGLVKRLGKGKRHSMDLHSSNVMFRRTPYGVQLVVTDPLSGFEGITKAGRLYHRAK